MVEDILVIGAGPAGLAAAVAGTAVGCTVCTVDAGHSLDQRDHSRAEDLGVGVGGCGLFSDGKFSFRPSATLLWSLDEPAVLSASERWATALLFAAGLTGDPSEVPIASRPTGSTRLTASQKTYPSFYLSLEGRRRLIQSLLERIPKPPLTGFRADRIEWLEEEAYFVCHGRQGNDASQLLARAIIFAGGRLGPLSWSHLFPSGPMVFRRVELGVRIEHDPAIGPLACFKELDVKLMYHSTSDRYEWRTFCSCRQGEVVGIRYGELMAYSGRADCPPSGRSNFGMHMRIKDQQEGLATWDAFQRSSRISPLLPPRQLHDVLKTSDGAGLRAYFGPTWHRLLDGLDHLMRDFPDLNTSTTMVYAPAVEGVGFYPDVSNSLQLAPFPIWIPGDASGLFRGNLAALVSGYYGGTLASSHIRNRYA